MNLFGDFSPLCGIASYLGASFKCLQRTLISLINVEPTLTNFEKFHPPQKKNPPSSFIDFITKVSDIIAEPDDNFSHDHFEL